MWRVRRGESVEKGSGSPEADYTLEKKRERTERRGRKGPEGEAAWGDWILFSRQKKVVGAEEGGQVHLLYT